MALPTRARAWWTLERFGFTPRKLLGRLGHAPGPKIACISIPKAGTHLLERAICLHPRLHRPLIRTLISRDVGGRRGLDTILESLSPWQVLITHFRYSEAFSDCLERHGVRGLFLQRDPRDIAVSQAHYVVKNPAHPHHDLFRSLPDTRERIKLAIRGDRSAGVESIAQRLASFVGWLDTGCLVVRFEDLVGPRGNGTAEKQRETVEAIYRHIGVEPTEPLIEHVTSHLFSDVSPTFRKGGTNQWREAFDDEIKALFKEAAGGTLLRFGYEEDDLW